jgi:hypothetical protein
VVSLQHYEINTTTGKEGNAYPDQVDPKFDNLGSATEFMLDYVDEYAPDAAVYFYMHWARAYKSNLNESLATYNKMAAFFPVVMNYTGTNSSNRFESIIPVGLAVQNARTTYLATLSYNSEKGITVNLQNDPQIGLQRDGGHMTYNVGRYLAALTFAETIIPDSLRAEGYVLPDIRVTESVGKLPKEYSEIVQKAVYAAVESWKGGSLAVTNIEGYTEDPAAAALKTLEPMTLSLNCGDIASLEQQTSAAVLAALAADFAVDAVAFNTETATVMVTIRYGYTSKTVEMAYTLTNHTYQNGTCTACGAEEPLTVVSGNIAYTISGNVVTVMHSIACKVGYWDEASQRFVALSCTTDGTSYSFAIPQGVKKVLLVAIGDIDGDGMLTLEDKELLDRFAGPAQGDNNLAMTQLQQFAADTNDNGVINTADRILLARALIVIEHPAYRAFSWNLP